jgi:hypothetical protein
VAEHNAGSAKVLRRARFVQLGAERSWAEGLGREVGETVHRLDEVGTVRRWTGPTHRSLSM